MNFNIRISRRSLATILLAAGVFVFFWATAPLWHWLFFSLIWRHIVGWIVLVIVIVLALAGLVFGDTEAGRFYWLTVVAILLALGYLYWSTDVYGRAVANSFEPEIVQEVPDTTNIRYTPYEVSLAFARARQKNPTRKVGDIDPVEIEGKFYWLAPRIPNGIGNRISGQADGVILIAEDGTARFEPQTFHCGEGMIFGDAISWKLFSTRYAAEYPEIFYLRIDDHWVAMAPYVTYDFHFPVWVPRWGGVMLVHPDCTVEDLTPEQAQADPRLQGKRLFPEALAKTYSLRWGYRFGGLWNRLWNHKEEVEVANLKGTENEMPYYLPTEWGPQWMMATEPSGPSQAIFKIFWFDAHSGKAKLTEFVGEGLIGPNRAMGYAKSETPDYTWLEGTGDARSGTYLAIEPRPIIRDGTLYWQYSVTTQEYAGVGLTILVNSQDTTDVLHFCSRESLMKWIAGKGGPDSIPCDRAAPIEVAPQPIQPVQPVPIGDLPGLTEEELYQLIRQIIGELEQRSQQ